MKPSEMIELAVRNEYYLHGCDFLCNIMDHLAHDYVITWEDAHHVQTLIVARLKKTHKETRAQYFVNTLGCVLRDKYGLETVRQVTPAMRHAYWAEFVQELKEQGQ